MEPKILLNLHCHLAEGPLWDQQNQILWWVNIMAGELHRTNPANNSHKTYNIGRSLGTVGLRQSGGLILATADGFATFDPNTETLTFLTDPEANKPENRFNDGKPAPNGSFFAGTMALNQTAQAGSLYRLNPNHTVDHLVPNITISNGLAWTQDQKTMYYIDSPSYTVYAFDYDNQTGQITNQRIAFTVPEEIGAPDGMTIDTEDMLWIAHYGGSAVHRWHPQTGKILETIQLPTPNITCCTFGGPNLDTLYITTAGGDTHPNTPAGALFHVKTPYTGLPPFTYKG